MLGTYALSAGYYDAYYRKAQKVRTLIRRDFDAAFDDCRRCSLRRPRRRSAFQLGEKVDDPLAMYVNDISRSRQPRRPAGHLVPCGLADGLPVGFQLIGPAFDENRLLRAAHALEQRDRLRSRVPPAVAEAGRERR